MWRVGSRTEQRKRKLGEVVARFSRQPGKRPLPCTRGRHARVAECLQCGRPGGGGGDGRVWKRVVPRWEEGRCPGCGRGRVSWSTPRSRVRGRRCLCSAFSGGEGRCPWCSLGCFSQRGRCPCMSPYAGHGKVLGVVVVGGQRRRAVRWQAGGSRRLPELDEARRGCVMEYGVKLGDASAGVR